MDSEGVIMGVAFPDDVRRLESKSMALNGQLESFFRVPLPDMTFQDQLFQLHELEECVKSRWELSGGNVFVTWRRTWVPARFMDGRGAERKLEARMFNLYRTCKKFAVHLDSQSS